ncbi:MAG: hypothetical protein QOJ15_4469 [Bradyrhizobium sp.]|jgi:hypothetical protein|nr:hypothetical protein [Bradyrhizobium sp.]
MSAKSIDDVLAAAAAMDRDDALHLARDLIVRAGRHTGITGSECLALTAAIAEAVKPDWEFQCRWVG